VLHISEYGPRSVEDATGRVKARQNATSVTSVQFNQQSNFKIMSTKVIKLLLYLKRNSEQRADNHFKNK
jgi:hypothetical protein